MDPSILMFMSNLAPGNRLPLGFVFFRLGFGNAQNLSFGHASRVCGLARLLAESCRLKVAWVNIPKVPHVSRETGFDMGL